MLIKEYLLRQLIYEVLSSDEVSYSIKLASDKMFSYNDNGAIRGIVIVETKGYGNVAFYRRSGHGNSNYLNPGQAEMFDWLPFGGIATEKDRLDSKNYQTGMYTAWGGEWFCKLPGHHPESDGTGKFLKEEGEFYKISKALTDSFDNLGLVQVANDVLIEQFFGKNKEELSRLETVDNFKLFYDVDRLFGALAINYCLFVKGALKLKWLPSSRFAFTGSKEWGKNIGHNVKSFKELIKNI